MAGAPIGNKNASKGKVWSDALHRAITQDQGNRVRLAAEKLLDEASRGGNRPLEPKALEVEFFPLEEVLHEEIKIY